MQKTKLVLTIEIEETLGQTAKLFSRIKENDGIINIKDIFDLDDEVTVLSLSDIHSVESKPIFIRGHMIESSYPPKTKMHCIVTKRIVRL